MRGITLCERSASASSSASAAITSGDSIRVSFASADDRSLSLSKGRSGDASTSSATGGRSQLVAELVFALLPAGQLVGGVVRAGVGEPVGADRDGHLARVGAC